MAVVLQLVWIVLFCIGGTVLVAGGLLSGLCEKGSGAAPVPGTAGLAANPLQNH